MVNELRSIIQVEIDSKQKLQLDNDDLEEEIANLRVELGESLQNFTHSENQKGKLQLEINQLKNKVQDEIRSSQNKATSANSAVAEQALNKLETEVSSLKEQLDKEKKLKVTHYYNIF
jgi:membrane-bound lytic murein transglycosylase